MVCMHIVITFLIALLATPTDVADCPPAETQGLADGRDCHHVATDNGYGGFCSLSGYWWFCRYTIDGQTCSDQHGNRW